MESQVKVVLAASVSVSHRPKVAVIFMNVSNAHLEFRDCAIITDTVSRYCLLFLVHISEEKKSSRHTLVLIVSRTQVKVKLLNYTVIVDNII